MRFFALLYAVAGLTFFFFPEEVFYLFNIAPRLLRFVEETPVPADHFWVVLSTSMMAMLVATSFLASVYPFVRGYAWIHLISKICSTAGFLYQFIHHQKYFAYFLGVLTDGPIALIVLFLALRTPFKLPEPEAPPPPAPAGGPA